jgi:multiple sugar transport system ATP-binding protein
VSSVSLKNIHKTFPGDIRAVDAVSLDVRDQEFLVLVGPSGCGKSTLLRMIAGLEEPTSGEICIGDRTVNGVPPKDRDVAMVFQNYALYPHMSVFDNMAFGLKMRKTPKNERIRLVDEAAEILGIADLMARKPGELSGGQRQRVALGRAIVRNPAVFLFDEPLSNLDALLRVEMRHELSQLHRRLETTMIYVTHDQIEAMTLGDRIVVMCDGIVQQVGQPLEVYDRPANRFVAGFLGTPPMNFLEGTVRKTEAGAEFVGGGESGASVLPLSEEMTARFASHVGEPLTLGIRPEQLRLQSEETHGRLTFTATVDDVQLLGGESLVHLQAGVWRLIARVESHREMEVGNVTRLTCGWDALHVFDATGQALLVTA